MKIFTSKITMNYHDSKIQEEYHKQMTDKIIKYRFLFPILLFITSLSNLAVHLFNLNKYKAPDFYNNFICICIISCLLIVIIILSISKKNIKLLRVINYTNYFLLAWIFSTFRYGSIYVMDNDTTLYYVFIFCEYLFRCMWHLLDWLISSTLLLSIL